VPKTYTFWYSILAAITGIIQQFVPFIPADKIGWALAAVSAVAAAIHKFEDSTATPTIPPGVVRALIPLFALAMLPLSGCSLLAPQLDKSAKAAGKAVTFYCQNVPDQAAREAFRAQVNQYAAPNSVAVTCANGTPALSTSPK
jgi:hypothetical protein